MVAIYLVFYLLCILLTTPNMICGQNTCDVELITTRESLDNFIGAFRTDYSVLKVMVEYMNNEKKQIIVTNMKIDQYIECCNNLPKVCCQNLEEIEAKVGEMQSHIPDEILSYLMGSEYNFITKLNKLFAWCNEKKKDDLSDEYYAGSGSELGLS